MIIDFSKPDTADWIVKDAETGERIIGIARACDDEGWVETRGADVSPHPLAPSGLPKLKRTYRRITINRIKRRGAAA